MRRRAIADLSRGRLGQVEVRDRQRGSPNSALADPRIQVASFDLVCGVLSLHTVVLRVRANCCPQVWCGSRGQPGGTAAPSLQISAPWWVRSCAVTRGRAGRCPLASARALTRRPTGTLAGTPVGCRCGAAKLKLRSTTTGEDARATRTPMPPTAEAAVLHFTGGIAGVTFHGRDAHATNHSTGETPVPQSHGATAGVIIHLSRTGVTFVLDRLHGPEVYP